ncbi:MAG TPA: selenoneine biosynthesis selenosugar synthase SenB [Kofleriaceae bacterium]|nr:selenoneine biosynthesis selenosugar synthase SenB [Kofleriaceae bacterium]
MRGALSVFVVTPEGEGPRGGNRVTALRWAKRLRELGCHVRVDHAWRGEPCEVLVALHARKSHASIARHARERERAPRVVALTGTDVYGELDDPEVRASLALATRLVALQPRALDRLAEDVRERTRVIRQAALVAPHALPLPGFTGCALAHLRDVKDPLLAARAVSLLPEGSQLRILHVGAACDASWAEAARRAEQAAHGRWSWLGALPRGEALRVLAGARLLVLTSRSEGGANAVSEAIAAGVPVISTRIAGSLGILGDDYPGYCEVGDAADLARRLARAERDPSYLAELRRRIVALQPLVAPGRERASWRALLDELGLAPCAPAP